MTFVGHGNKASQGDGKVIEFYVEGETSLLSATVGQFGVKGIA